jgi:predicted nucleic acid-binding protein
MTQALAFLLDTMVVSEARKRRQNPAILRFLQSHPPSSMAMSAVTLAELRRGAENPRLSREERVALHRWTDGLEVVFEGRILNVDKLVAREWGSLAAGRTKPIVDSFLAATAIVHNLTLVTRNERDFADMPVKLLNPWVE